MLVEIVGEYKSGKTVSACTFPKPILFLDFDNGYESINYAKGTDGKLIVNEGDIEVISFFRSNIYALDILPSKAPLHAKDDEETLKEYNKIIEELGREGMYGGKKYKTIVIDSLSEMFRVWTNVIFKLTNSSSLQIQHYKNLDNTLNNQFFKSLKTLLYNKVVNHIICVNHVEMDKDELTGAIVEYPCGPSKNMGKEMGKHFDEIFRMRNEAGKYVWRTRKTGFFQAGSRHHLPDPVEANYKHIANLIG